MAFEKRELLYNGEEVCFHSVVECLLDMSTGAASCVVGSWRSRDEFVAHATPLIRRVWNFSPVSDDLVADAWGALRASAHWQGAGEVEP